MPTTNFFAYPKTGSSTELENQAKPSCLYCLYVVEPTS
jgi:hypothetical protein